MKKLMILGAVLLLAACGGKNPQTATNSTDSTQVAAADSAATDSAVADTSCCGTYRGTLPAADCEGIKTVLTIPVN